jgi:HEAT repeat protein
MRKCRFILPVIFSVSLLLTAQENPGSEQAPAAAETSADTLVPADSISSVDSDEGDSADHNVPDSESEDVVDARINKSKKSVSHKPGLSDVPDEKRPEKQDKDKIKELDETYPDTRKENADTLKYGMEDDIVELLDKLVKNEDIRFTDEVYDLFQTTKNSLVREKILEYFTKLEDPCLEDYAVMILNDPYDEKNTTVGAVFKYIQTVKTVEAIPAVLTLLENEDEDYFNHCLTTLGEIGGAEEAVYLTQYLEREDLSLGQKQQLVKVLGKIKAVETYDALVEMAQDEDENTFIRMYASEAIGNMGKEDAVDILVKLYEDRDPKLRSYVIKGLACHKDNEEAKKTVLEAIRDSHVSVRLEAIDACVKNDYKEAVPFMIYRLEKDKEDAIKKKCYPAIAKLDTKEGNEYLIKQITDKKVADTPKSRIATALLENGDTGTKEIIELARETVKDDRRKQLRYALGKEFAKYKRSEFADICKDYLASKDTATQGTGLDIYAKGRYSSVTPDVQKIVTDAAKTPSKKNANAEKAARILGKTDSAVIEAEKIREEAVAAEEARKKAAEEKVKKQTGVYKKTGTVSAPAAAGNSASEGTSATAPDNSNAK